MKTRTGPSRLRLRGRFAALAIALAFALGFAHEASFEASAASGSKPGKGATVYIIRGGGGYFPNLGNIVNQHFESRGLNVVDYRVHQRPLAAREIIDAYRTGKLPHGVLLVGYSLGGTGSIRLAQMLEEAKVPVRLLFLIETVSPDLLVPANVKACFNLYHAPASVVGPVRAASAKTKLVNCEAHGDAGFGKEYSHFAIPWVDGVHELVAGEIVNVIQNRPLGQVAPNRLRVKTAQAAAIARPASAPKTKAKAVAKPKAKTKAKTRPEPKPKAKSRTRINPFSSFPWSRKPASGVGAQAPTQMRGW